MHAYIHTDGVARNLERMGQGMYGLVDWSRPEDAVDLPSIYAPGDGTEQREDEDENDATVETFDQRETRRDEDGGVDGDAMDIRGSDRTVLDVDGDETAGGEWLRDGNARKTDDMDVDGGDGEGSAVSTAYFQGQATATYAHVITSPLK